MPKKQDRPWWIGYTALALIALTTLLLFYREPFVVALREVSVWLSVEYEAIVRQLGTSLWRLARTLLLATALGVGTGLLLRINRDIEGWLTPWLLTMLALPWLPIIVLLNLLAGLTEEAALWVGALAAAPHLAYALRPLSSAKNIARGFLSAYRLVFFAIALAELLGRDSGVGAQLRFFFLFWNPPRLVAYGVILLLLWLFVEGMTRLAGTIVMRSQRRLRGAKPRSSRA